jgi:transposase
MLALSDARRYFLYSADTNMRQSFDSLSGIVRNELHQDPLGGDIFIFFNRRRNQIKLLLWERDGFSIYYKRLEKGTYELPQMGADSGSVKLQSHELLLILQGISLSSVKKRKRFCLAGSK